MLTGITYFKLNDVYFLQNILILIIIIIIKEETIAKKK